MPAAAMTNTISPAKPKKVHDKLISYSAQSDHRKK